MMQIERSALAYLWVSCLQSPRGNVRSHKQVLPPMLPCNPPNLAVGPIVFFFHHSNLLPVAAMLAASLPVRLQLAGPPQNLDFDLVEVHPAQLQSDAAAALLALAAAIAVAAFLATLNFELPGISAAQRAGVPSLLVGLAAVS